MKAIITETYFERSYDREEIRIILTITAWEDVFASQSELQALMDNLNPGRVITTLGLGAPAEPDAGRDAVDVLPARQYDFEE